MHVYLFLRSITTIYLWTVRNLSLNWMKEKQQDFWVVVLAGFRQIVCHLAMTHVLGLSVGDYQIETLRNEIQSRT